MPRCGDAPAQPVAGEVPHLAAFQDPVLGRVITVVPAPVAGPARCPAEDLAPPLHCADPGSGVCPVPRSGVRASCVLPQAVSRSPDGGAAQEGTLSKNPRTVVSLPSPFATATSKPIATGSAPEGPSVQVKRAWR